MPSRPGRTRDLPGEWLPAAPSRLVRRRAAAASSAHRSSDELMMVTGRARARPSWPVVSSLPARVGTVFLPGPVSGRRVSGGVEPGAQFQPENGLVGVRTPVQGGLTPVHSGPSALSSPRSTLEDGPRSREKAQEVSR